MPLLKMILDINRIVPSFFLLIASLHAQAQDAPRNSELPPERLLSESTVELHAHLFMNEGLTWLFRGDFFGELQADSHRDKLSTQTNPRTLQESGNAIVVATLYANGFTAWDLRESIRRQLTQAERFVSENPNWIIARDPRQAGRAIAEGKRVLVLALEGAAGILENDADLREFIDNRGISIVTPLHLTDDQFGGVALMAGIKVLNSPLAWLRSLYHRATRPTDDPEVHCEGVPINDAGLSAQGFELVDRLLERKVWIDLSHASDRATREMLPLIKKQGQPPLYTHTILRRYHQAERGLPDWMLPELRREGGIVGLMTSESMLDGTPPDSNDCGFACHRSTSATRAPFCEGGLPALARQYRELVRELGASSVMLGSDWQGGVDHLPPTCGSGTPLDSRAGFWNISQTGAVWDLLERLQTGAPRPRNLQVQRFLSAWERVR